MASLANLHEELETKIPKNENTGITHQLDEAIIDELPKKNTKQKLSENTKQAYKAAIRDYNQFLVENGLKISQESLKMYFDEIKRKVSPNTLNLRKSALLKCIKAQIGENNILKYMAIERVFAEIDSYRMDKSVSHDECLTENEIQILIESAQSKKTQLIIHFLYKTACRVSEMINIRLKDCRLINGHIKIRVVGKGKKARFVYIPTELYEAIRQEYNGKIWLFESKTGKQLSRKNIGHQIKKAAKRIGMTHYSPHMLRHARATDMLLNKGVSLKAVSKYLGHSSVAITAQMYVHDEVNASALFAQDLI